MDQMLKDDPTHVFETPCKRIKTFADMQLWDKSSAYFEYVGFILAINESIQGQSNSKGSGFASENIRKIVEMLDDLDVLIDQTPPIEQPQRFGNQAFRTWYEKLQDGIFEIMHGFLPKEYHRAVPEIMVYLIEAFGNSTRIDYGTGHEISFIMFLCCLFKIGYLKEADKPATACKVFVRYLELARKLQKTYRMEPAGSHGVWSLDDYQFVPFIWGSSQLIDHENLKPTSFLNENLVEMYAHDYMFFSCIKYINEVKKGPFAEHSNQLWSISAVPNWTKINGGLIKMYKAEVLGKFPVIQHIVFGTLFTLKPVEPGNSTIRRPVIREEETLVRPSGTDDFKIPTWRSSTVRKSQLPPELDTRRKTDRPRKTIQSDAARKSTPVDQASFASTTPDNKSET